MSTTKGLKPEEFIKGAQTALQWTVLNVRNSLGEAITRLNNLTKGQWQSASVLKAANSEEKSAAATAKSRDQELSPWRMNSSWKEETPNLEVTVPKGSLCELRSEFIVGIPPNALFDILIDPENKRVFKDIQALNFREVLEDGEDRQLVEMEQVAIWRFLWMSGTLNVRLLVDQDRRSHTVKYRLSQEGFMKKFEGSWKIEPVFVDLDDTSVSSASTPGRVASLVKLHQDLQPALVPPPPISWYVRGITAKATERLLLDLQVEAKRLREGSTLDEMQLQEKIDLELKESPVLHRQLKPSLKTSPGVNRRKTRRNHLRDKQSSD
eukprot:TRINITY_DN15687_c0_g1_i1.p1 TRINITY_DN15687_c0_g1~~TRINITY_DN15687_c0_g1_i1.p1  ORF type:complete len:323 (+),score=53.47 TRINITY_DN15687_c0_g1_i1:226-1194(+)